MLPEAILKFDPGSASAETTRVRGRARLGQMQGRARGTAQLPWPCFLRFPSSCPAPWRAALLTCGRQQQGAVLPVQVLHRCDPGVPWVPVVEIIQFFPFLPVPETGGGKNTRGERNNKLTFATTTAAQIIFASPNSVDEAPATCPVCDAFFGG